MNNIWQLCQIGLKAFFLQLPQSELTKSLQSKAGNERIPDAEYISGVLRQSFDAMCDSKPFGRLLTESDNSSLDREGLSLQFSLWAAMMKDLPVFRKEFFFSSPG